MRALIDGDILVYRCGFAAEHKYYKVYPEGEVQTEETWIAKFPYKKDAIEWVGGQEDLVIVPETEVEPVENAIQNVKTLINSIKRDTLAHDYTIYLTGEDNFREKVATILPYKGNRDDDHKPFWYGELKEYLVFRHCAEIIDGEEADDAMSIAHLNSDEPTVICTTDKDLNMVPGLHYDFGKKRMFNVGEEEGLLFFYTQMLTGDSTDNIPGLYKLTKARASQQMKNSLMKCSTEKDMWEYVKYQYNRRDVEDDKIIEIGQLLWMRREPNQMWEPPK